MKSNRTVRPEHLDVQEIAAENAIVWAILGSFALRVCIRGR